MWLATLQRDNREAERHQINTDATLRVSQNEPVDILIADVSTTGCLFVCSAELDIGGVVTVGFAGLGKLEARIVRKLEQRYGAVFVTPLADAAVLTARATPSESIISLPIWERTAPTNDAEAAADDLRATERWPRQARILLLLACALSSWAVLLAIVRLV